MEEVAVTSFKAGLGALLEAAVAAGQDVCTKFELDDLQKLLALPAPAALILSRLLYLQGPWHRKSTCLNYVGSLTGVLGEQAFQLLLSEGILIPPAVDEWDYILRRVLQKPELVAIHKNFQSKGSSSLSKPSLVASILQTVSNKRTIFQSSPLSLHKIVSSALRGESSIFKIAPKYFQLCVRASRWQRAFISQTAMTAADDENECDDWESVRIRGGFRLPACYSPGFAMAMNLPVPITTVKTVAFFESRLDLVWLESMLCLQIIVSRAIKSASLSTSSGEGLDEHCNGQLAECIANEDLMNLLLSSNKVNDVHWLSSLSLQLLFLVPEFKQRAPHLYSVHDSAHVLSNLLFDLVECMEGSKQYQAAVEILQALVDSERASLLLHRKRALWFQRLVIDLAHLKRQDEVLATCQRAVTVLDQNQDWLWPYFHAKLNAKPGKDSLGFKTECIQARPFLRRTKNGGKQLFLREDDSSEVTCDVETFALEYYVREQGWTAGYHLENFIFKLLFKLLMRQVCFGATEAERAEYAQKLYISPNQQVVLDLRTRHFYANRRAQVDSRVREMETWSCKELAAQVGSAYVEFLNELDGTGNAKRRNLPVSLVQIIAASMGSTRLAKLCLYFSQNYASLGSGGAPDLILIKANKSLAGFPCDAGAMMTLMGDEYFDDNVFECKFVEVKSDSDQVSPKQVFWLRFLKERCGFEVELFKIQPVSDNCNGRKKARRPAHEQQQGGENEEDLFEE